MAYKFTTYYISNITVNLKILQVVHSHRTVCLQHYYAEYILYVNQGRSRPSQLGAKGALKDQKGLTMHVQPYQGRPKFQGAAITVDHRNHGRRRHYDSGDIKRCCEQSEQNFLRLHPSQLEVEKTNGFLNQKFVFWVFCFYGFYGFYGFLGLSLESQKQPKTRLYTDEGSVV